MSKIIIGICVLLMVLCAGYFPLYYFTNFYTPKTTAQLGTNSTPDYFATLPDPDKIAKYKALNLTYSTYGLISLVTTGLAFLLSLAILLMTVLGF